MGRICVVWRVSVFGVNKCGSLGRRRSRRKYILARKERSAQREQYLCVRQQQFTRMHVRCIIYLCARAHERCEHGAPPNERERALELARARPPSDFAVIHAISPVEF